MLEGSTTEWGEIPMYQNQTIDGLTYFVVTAYFTRPSTTMHFFSASAQFLNVIL